MTLDIAFTDGSPAPAFQGPSSPTATPVAAPAPLSLVPGPAPRTQQPNGYLEKFEGAQVGATEIKISGQCSVDTGGDLMVTLDDLVRAIGVYRVIKVLHYVHPKTGETIRQMVVSPVDQLVVTPFDATNPLDDGIVRARP